MNDDARQTKYARLSEYVALLYHEARCAPGQENAGGGAHGRVHEGMIRLPKDRHVAWKTIQPIIESAKMADSVDNLLGVFEERYGISIGELQGLFMHPAWVRGWGGKPWAMIAGHVQKFADAIKNNDEKAEAEAVNLVENAKHNTGTVGGKIAKLNHSL